MAISHRRLVRNQALFRDVNERLLQVTGGADRTATFLCECSRPDCVQTFELTVADYERIRSHPFHFVIALDHEIPEIERRVEEGGSWMIVEKTEGLDVLAHRDPRSSPAD